MGSLQISSGDSVTMVFHFTDRYCRYKKGKEKKKKTYPLRFIRKPVSVEGSNLVSTFKTNITEGSLGHLPITPAGLLWQSEKSLKRKNFHSFGRGNLPFIIIFSF